MPTYLLTGNRFEPAGGIPLTDRGFRYGMSVFETIAFRGRAPLLLGPHLARIEESAARARFRPPAGWLEAGRAILQAPPIEEGVARLYVTAGDHDGAESRVALLFETMPIPVDLRRARAVTVEFTPVTPFGKTGNYWPHLLARPAGDEEAILVTPRGEVLGGATSNLVLVRDGQLLTPAHPVRRGVVCEWAGAAPAPLTRADLAAAEAAFLTNSRFGFCELLAIDGQALPGSDQSPRSGPAPDEILAPIWRRYRSEVLRVR